MKKLLFVSLLAIGAALASADSLYVVSDTNNHELYRIDTSTLAVTAVGSLGIDGSNQTFGGLAYDTKTQTMYYSGGQGDNNLYTINLTTGAATLVGSDGQTNMFALGYDPANDTLYAGTHSGAFGSVNTSTGAFTSIGNNAQQQSAYTYNGLTSKLIMGEPNEAFSINLATGGATFAGIDGAGTNSGIAFDAALNEYFVYDDSGDLITDNSAFNTVSTKALGIGNVTAMAYVAAVPEPISMTLLGVGALSIIRRRARKTN